MLIKLETELTLNGLPHVLKILVIYMNKQLGYSLISIGVLCSFFFLKYNGTRIPLKELWFVLSIFTLIAGSCLLAKSKLKELNNQSDSRNRNRLAEVARLKTIGDQLRVTLDNAEVKSRSFRQEIINDGFSSRKEMLDGLYDSNRNYKTQEIQQTYIVFYRHYNGQEYKFISQATTQNADALKMYIHERKGIDLFIDPKNPTKYYFDLDFL